MSLLPFAVRQCIHAGWAANRREKSGLRDAKESHSDEMLRQKDKAEDSGALSDLLREALVALARSACR
jgi:hypothetical protein